MKNEKRILIIPSWYPPDGGYFFQEHSEAILKKGWKVDVLVNRLVGIRKLIKTGRSALQGYQVKDENGLRVIRSFYLKMPGNEKYNIHGWARRTLRIYEKYEKQFGRPDLILAHSVTWAAYAACLIKFKHSIPYVIVEHRSFFVWSTKEARQMVKPFHIPFFELTYTHCEKLVLVSDSLKKGIEALVPSAMKQSIVIPNMIREDLFFPPKEARKSDPFVFLWAGRLEHVKGVDLLLEAVKTLSDTTGLQFSVRLAGKGSLREELEQQAVALGVSDRVFFLGRLSRNEMLKEMQEANCKVLPSRYEAFGVVLIEATATGLPLIATRSGGPDSIVTKENGILVERENPDELASAMKELMTNISTYSAKEIRAQTLKRYGDSSVMEQYNQLFLQLLEE
ncbi:MAG: glycosyltransferase [Bacteroidales bacterium]|nr:glycosyltransferase [Bacteroidales bacterium]